MVFKIAYFFGLVVSVTHGIMSPTETYIHSATLKTGNVRLYWKFNDTHITFEVHAETTGWIGIGFSSNGAMAGADIYIGWVKNGQATVTDRHGGAANGYPPLDPQQDVDLLGGAECDGWTMLKFSRQLAACEAKYDREITQHTQRLMWAWGETDPAGDDVPEWDYHEQRRGTESMLILQSTETPSGLPDGPEYKTFDALANNFVIPAEDTYYNCKIFKLPPLSKKHHIVKHEAIIQKGNELNVHHMLVYRCGDALENPSELKRDARCYVPNMQHFKTCTTVIAEWAIGAGAILYPLNAGLSIGDEGDPIYIQVEVHYDNPLMQSGIVDNSGIRFTYTDTLRQHDVGVIQMGTRPSSHEHFIPPGTKNFLSVGYCSAECLKIRLGNAGRDSIKVFSVMLHSHLAGRSLRLRLIRDGVEQPYPADDLHYDFNYQEARVIHPHLVLSGAERLQMECVYNTEDRVNVTVGGLGTRDEMCLSFVYYYPRIDLSYCLSSVKKETSFSYFGVDPATIEPISGKRGLDSFSVKPPGGKLERMSGSDFINRIEWTPEKIAHFESSYNSMEHTEYCTPANRSNRIFTLFNTTEIKTPYVRPRKACSVTPQPLSQTVQSHGCFSATDTPVEITTNRAASTVSYTGRNALSWGLLLESLSVLVVHLISQAF